MLLFGLGYLGYASIRLTGSAISASPRYAARRLRYAPAVHTLRQLRYATTYGHRIRSARRAISAATPSLNTPARRATPTVAESGDDTYRINTPRQMASATLRAPSSASHIRHNAAYCGAPRRARSALRRDRYPCDE